MPTVLAWPKPLGMRTAGDPLRHRGWFSRVKPEEPWGQPVKRDEEGNYIDETVLVSRGTVLGDAWLGGLYQEDSFPLGHGLCGLSVP